MAFDTIKQRLLEAPTLSLPNINKFFLLYVDENKAIAKGIWTQNIGPWKTPVAYLTKKLDTVASGWPPFLHIIVAVPLLVKDADELTLGQNLEVYTTHALESILMQPPDRWLSNVRMTHYQTLLLNLGRITFLTSPTLNPATMLLDPDIEAPLHDCTEILAQAYCI